MKSNIIHVLWDVIRLCILYDTQHTLYKATRDNTDCTINQGWDQVPTLMQARDLRNDKPKSSGSEKVSFPSRYVRPKQESFYASQTILRNNSLPYSPLLLQWNWRLLWKS